MTSQDDRQYIAAQARKIAAEDPRCAPTRPSMALLGDAEWRKIRGRGLVWAVLLFGLLHGIAAPLLVRGMLFLGYKAAGDPAALGDPVDWLVGGDLALSFAVFPVNGFALLLLASIVWAEDFSLGTMAMIFVRPVARWKVFASKAITAWGAGCLSLALALAAGLLLGLPLLGTTGDVSQLGQVPLVGWMAQVPADPAAAPTALAASERFARIQVGMLAGWVLLGPVVAAPALVAALFRSPIWTLSGSMVLLTLDFFVWAVTAAWGSSDIRWSEFARTLSRLTIWGSRKLYALHGSGEMLADGWSALLVSCAWTLLLGGLAAWAFVRRDVT